jgi:hypothetical protein
MMVNTFWIFLVTYKLLFSAIQKELQTIIQDLTHPFLGGWSAGLKSGTRFITKPSKPQDQKNEHFVVSGFVICLLVWTRGKGGNFPPSGGWAAALTGGSSGTSLQHEESPQAIGLDGGRHFDGSCSAGPGRFSFV